MRTSVPPSAAQDREGRRKGGSSQATGDRDGAMALLRLTDQDFTNIFAMAQAIPGPNMILMMGLIGWKVWGLIGALSASTAPFAPPCAIYFAAFRLMHRFREAHWQRVLRSALIPVTTGLII